MDDSANRKGKDPLALVLLTVAALFGALSLYRLSALAVPAKTPQIEVNKKTQPGDAQAQVAADRSAAGSLKKKNLFMPPGAPRNPVTEVAGILGSEALINGKWYKVGAKVGEGPNAAVIMAVEPTKVLVKWDGKETEFLPIHASGASSGGRPSEGNPPGLAEVRRGAPVAVRAQSTPAPPSGARRGAASSEAAALAERMRNASSPEERRQIMEEMRGTRRMIGQ